MYSLSVIYRSDIRQLFAWYGVELEQFAADLGLVNIGRSHKVEGLDSAINVQMPQRMDPAFDVTRTSALGRMILQWGAAPLAYLGQFASGTYSYAYVGSEDWTMYPLILPGSFVQIDETKNTVVDGKWNSEIERPIYFVETHDGYTCCWCALRDSNLVLHPHPLSPATARVLRHPQDAEIIGQLVGVAMRLDLGALDGRQRPAKDKVEPIRNASSARGSKPPE
jgi:hypothetical protein